MEQSERGGIPIGDVIGKVLFLMLAGTKLGVRRWDLGWEKAKCQRDSQDSGL